MRSFIACCLLTVSLILAGCSGGKDKELFTTAEFEELQNNREHAKKLYEELLRKYPDSEYAARAKAQISKIAEAEGNPHPGGE